jgi:hypothetical protein
MNSLTPLTNAERARGAKHIGTMTPCVHHEFAEMLEERLYMANVKLGQYGLTPVRTDNIHFLKDKNTK